MVKKNYVPERGDIVWLNFNPARKSTRTGERVLFNSAHTACPQMNVASLKNVTGGGSGHEQKGKRPAIVVSPKAYNEKVGLSLFCPITSKIKNYPFEVKISNKKITGVVLSDQIKSLDWKTREIEFIEKENPEKVNEIINKISVLLFE